MDRNQIYLAVQENFVQRTLETLNQDVLDSVKAEYTEKFNSASSKYDADTQEMVQQMKMVADFQHNPLFYANEERKCWPFNVQIMDAVSTEELPEDLQHNFSQIYAIADRHERIVDTLCQSSTVDEEAIFSAIRQTYDTAGKYEFDRKVVNGLGESSLISSLAHDLFPGEIVTLAFVPGNLTLDYVVKAHCDAIYG